MFYLLVIVEAADACHQANFNIGSLTTTTRKWNIRVTQYACGDFDSSGNLLNTLVVSIFYHFGRYIFLGQIVSVGNYRGVVSSRDKIFYVGPSTHTWGYGKFVNARYARFTNSNAKLRLRLRLHLDFLPSLRSGQKPAIRPCAFIRPYIN